MLLEETFEKVNGYYLDKNTSLLETLSTISAAKASIAVGGQCASLAAQVKHTTFYLQVVEGAMRDPNSPAADWGKIWSETNVVTDQEWKEIINDLMDAVDPDKGIEKAKEIFKIESPSEDQIKKASEELVKKA